LLKAAEFLFDISVEIATRLQESIISAKELEPIIYRAYAKALEIIHYTLA
jgi:hypothetical protein